MTDKEAEAIAARANAATPGPWGVWEPTRSDTEDMPNVEMIDQNGEYWHSWRTTYIDYGKYDDHIYTRREAALLDAAFIAHARTDVVALLAERATLRDVMNRIINRYRDTEGTPLAEHWGLPWAMAQDAAEALGLPASSIHKNEEADGNF